MSLESEIDRLYSLPLNDFTSARNSLAKRLRAEGDRESSARVKALAKPTVSAWAVNRLYATARPDFDELLELGAEQRRSIVAGAGPQDGVLERKRSALATLMRAVEEILREGGGRLTQSLRHRISRTLEALAARPAGGDAVSPGRFSQDLEPVGFDALVGTAIAPAPPAGGRKPGAGRAKRTVRNPRERAAAGRQFAAAQREVTAHKVEVLEARKSKTGAARKLKRLESKATTARKAATEARRKAEATELVAAELELALREARAELERVAQTLERRLSQLSSAERRVGELKKNQPV